MTVAGLMLSYGGAALDDYFEYVTMLLPGNGTNGAQNNTFLDSSTNNFTITRNGNTTQGTFSPYGDNWSNYFSSNGLNLPANSALTIGSSDGTIEAWIYPVSGVGDASAQFIWGISSTTQSGSYWLDEQFIYDPVNKKLNFSTNISSGSSTYYQLATPNNSVTPNQWSHVAFVKSGTTWTIYINGVSQATGSKSNLTTTTSGASFGIGYRPPAGNAYLQYFGGYISNFRLVKGTAVYTAGFTPSTSPLTAITNTSLLTCQSNRFIDNSTNAFAVTTTNTPSVQRFSPFSPSAAYSTATVGGSMYLDGTGDYLSVPDNAALEGFTGNFTIEMWCYFKTSNAPVVITKGADVSTTYAPYLIYGVGSDIYFAGSNDGSSWAVVTVPIISGVKIGQWYHIAVTRSGSTYYTFSNGTLVSTGTWSGTLMTNSADVRFGISSAGTKPMDGYMTDARIVTGTAVYTASFTPPTAPLTAISGTQLLLSTTNAGIIDNAMMNDLETVGNAQISTTQSKFGGSSMYFDGTGDYLTVNNATANLCAFGTGDFTVEAWIYIASNSAIQILIDARGSQLASDPWQFYTSSTGKLVFNYGSNLTGSTTISANTWTHVAACRASGTLRLFVNGTQDTSATVTGSVNAVAPVYVGRTFDTSGTLYLNGYIDDLRITKGYARYTANFTAPTAAFPTS